MSVVFFEEAWAFVEDRRHNLLLGDGFSIVVEARHLPPLAIAAQNLRITNEIVSNRICADEQ